MVEERNKSLLKYMKLKKKRVTNISLFKLIILLKYEGFFKTKIDIKMSMRNKMDMYLFIFILVPNLKIWLLLIYIILILG